MKTKTHKIEQKHIFVKKENEKIQNEKKAFVIIKTYKNVYSINNEAIQSFSQKRKKKC